MSRGTWGQSTRMRMRLKIHFARAVCEGGAVALSGGEWSRRTCCSSDRERMNIAGRAAESDGQWRKRYGLILKRRHGLGRLRVRGGERVSLPQALACNVKRMVDDCEMDETARHFPAAACAGDAANPVIPTDGVGPPQRPHDYTTPNRNIQPLHHSPVPFRKPLVTRKSTMPLSLRRR